MSLYDKNKAYIQLFKAILFFLIYIKYYYIGISRRIFIAYYKNTINNMYLKTLNS